MAEHRLVRPLSPSIPDIFYPPFSSFSHVENVYGNSTSIRRLFSLARSNNATRFQTEKIPAVGIIENENKEIASFHSDYSMPDLHRVSFWRKETDQDIHTELGEILIGYAILKQDSVPSKNFNFWHVFEAVFEKYPHPHNCVPIPCNYQVFIVDRILSIKGLLYAQQNSLNKSCAQVALRSLISRIKDDDISYKEINDLAEPFSVLDYDPARGLNAKQIQAVLNGLNIPFKDMDYTQYDFSLFHKNILKHNKKRKSVPYQTYVYSGIESGLGALVGFRLTRGSGGKHIIPFYGHTFNKDTWAPDADFWYFKIGKNLKYISSQYWTSSFLGHDDNFGANYCIPRLYLEPNNVDYVVELLKPHFVVRGNDAEGLTYYLLASVISQISSTNNIWLYRLANYHNESQIVLRAIAAEKQKYIAHMKSVIDWEGHFESNTNIELLNKILPDAFWVVEISVPQLFPANERKLGDVIINGYIDVDLNDIYKNLLYIRLPGAYYALSKPATGKTSHVYFKDFPSSLISHVDVLKLD